VNTLLRTILRGAIYGGLRRLGLAKTLALGAIALVALISVSGARAAELAYTVRTTSLNFTAATPAAAEELIAGTFDLAASTKVRVELSGPNVKYRAAVTDNLSLWIDGAETLERWASWRGGSADSFGGIERFSYLTLSAGTHTVSLRAHTYGTGTGSIYSNTGGDLAPVVLRVSSEPIGGAAGPPGPTGPAGPPGPAGDSTSCGSIGQPDCAVVLGGDSQAALLDVRHAAAWTAGLLVFGLVVMPLWGRVFHRGEGRW